MVGPFVYTEQTEVRFLSKAPNLNGGNQIGAFDINLNYVYYTHNLVSIETYTNLTELLLTFNIGF